jgi:hypothetical protein
MADTADSNVIDRLNKLAREQASTMPGSGSYNLGRSDRTKQHVDGKISQNNSDGTSADRQSSQNHVSSKINIQDKTKGMCTSDDDNIEKETFDSVVLEKSSCRSDLGIKIRDVNSITYNEGGVDQI